MKGDFVQLAETYDKNMFVGGWFYSEKLDGVRCLWDGGISRGVPVEKVPWCNLEKGGEGKVATGLWSRYGNPFFAPSWFLDKLPQFIVDGELWVGRGMFNETVSTVKKHNPIDAEWRRIQYKIFDAVPHEDWMLARYINDPNYKISIDERHLAWVKSSVKRVVVRRPYSSQLKFMEMFLPCNDVISIHEQRPLSFKLSEIHTTLHKELNKVTQLGGEGLIIRNPQAHWFPKRNRNLLKLKNRIDTEGIVVGYYSAALGKLHGRIGSLIVDYGGIRFKVSGFTDEEREFANTDSILWAHSNPESVAPDWVMSKHFPRGKVITFDYSELSPTGVPCKAAYVRPYESC